MIDDETVPMPGGNPKPQTIASEKVAGWISKTYKLKKKLCDEFQAVCTQTGKGQATVLSELMQSYIDEHSRK